MKNFKFIIFLILLHFSYALHAQENCTTTNKPTLDLKITSGCIPNSAIDIDMDIEIKQPMFKPELSYQENLDQKNSANINLEQSKKSSANIDAFIQPYKFRKRDDTNSHDRYQHNLDNFRLPVFTCDLPAFDTYRPEIFSIEEITQLDTALKKYHYCLNKSGEDNRETFKTFIVNKLDGKIIPSKGQKIQWATLPEHKQQTMTIMRNINKLYDERYALYLNTNQQLKLIHQQLITN